MITSPPNVSNSAPLPNPFDLDSLRLPTNMDIAQGVVRALTTVPVKKPERDWWIRVHDNPAYSLDAGMITLTASNECYLVTAAIMPELSTERTIRRTRLFAAVNRQGTCFIWPAVVPDMQKPNEWHVSALDAAKAARGQWTRVVSNQDLGAYEYSTSAMTDSPKWPSKTMSELVAIAFKGRIITSIDHTVLRELRGEV